MLRFSSSTYKLCSGRAIDNSKRWLCNSNNTPVGKASFVGRGTRKMSSTPSNGGTKVTTTSKTPEQTQHEYLVEANKTMENYHNAKMKALRGDLKLKEPLQTNKVQMVVIGMFLIAFCCTPLLGKKIAKDEDFRKKYIPWWYDYTVEKPESAWTREELHQQILQVQKEIRERAKKGDFSPEKLSKMRRYMEGLDPDVNSTFDPSKDPHAWSKIHPGVDDDEEAEE